MNLNGTLPVDSDQRMLKIVKGLMLCRVIILTLLLTIAFLFQLSDKKFFFIPMTNSFYYFISLFYLITIAYGLFLRKFKKLHSFAFVQILLDHLFIVGLIYFTGGVESFFPITFIFIIIGSSILFYKRGAFLSASFSTLLYGLLLLLQLYRGADPLGRSPGLSLQASQTFYSLILYMAAFYIVAFLSSTISEELRKKKKELLQKQVDYHQLETFNRNIIQSLDSGLLTIDLQGKINFFNRTAEKILNLNTESSDLYIYDLFPKINDAIEELRKKVPHAPPDYQRYETLFRNKEEKKVHLGFSISPLTGPESALIGHTLIFQDITRFKEMEEQMKRFDKMAAIGLLAAGMAHEIRNPLASLSGSIQMLQADLQLDEPQRHLMEITLRESERLNALITDFLLFAHPPETNKTLLEMDRVIGETVELFTHSPVFHEGIRVVHEKSHKLARALIDPDQLRQVFWNLFINAAQSLNGGGEIRVRLEKEKEDFWGTRLPFPNPNKTKEWIKISISDTGAGITPEDKEKIFEPFFTTKEGGTGLGLSIVHKIIENHQGIIQVESEAGKGSTFHVFLPVE